MLPPPAVPLKQVPVVKAVKVVKVVGGVVTAVVPWVRNGKVS